MHGTAKIRDNVDVFLTTSSGLVATILRRVSTVNRRALKGPPLPRFSMSRPLLMRVDAPLRRLAVTVVFADGECQPNPTHTGAWWGVGGKASFEGGGIGYRGTPGVRLHTIWNDRLLSPSARGSS